MRAAASTADDYATGAARTLGAVLSDATRALEETITTASGQLRAIAGTLDKWAQAAESYSSEAHHIVSQAETHWAEIKRNRRTLATVEDEAREAPENALAYGYRQRALEQEIEQDYVALGTLLGRLHEEDARLAVALLEGHERIGGRRASSVRDLGARALELDPAGDAYFLWVLLDMDADDKKPAGYDYVDLPLFNTDIYGNAIISSTDVSQGRYGDCWFIATLMAVAAQKPEIIKEMITKNEETGMYTVIFYDDDLKPHPIVVDGRLLIDTDGFTYGAGQPEDKVLWPAIAEKALAEYLGGYPQIENDVQSRAIRLITGSDDIHTEWIGLGPVEWFDDDTNATALAQTLADGGIAVASTKHFGLLWGEDSPHDLAASHSYQVVSVYGDTVTVQNPWGTESHDPIQLTWDEFHNYFQGVSWTD